MEAKLMKFNNIVHSTIILYSTCISFRNRCHNNNVLLVSAASFRLITEHQLCPHNIIFTDTREMQDIIVGRA